MSMPSVSVRRKLEGLFPFWLEHPMKKTAALPVIFEPGLDHTLESHQQTRFFSAPSEPSLPFSKFGSQENPASPNTRFTVVPPSPSNVPEGSGSIPVEFTLDQMEGLAEESEEHLSKTQPSYSRNPLPTEIISKETGDFTLHTPSTISPGNRNPELTMNDNKNSDINLKKKRTLLKTEYGNRKCNEMACPGLEYSNGHVDKEEEAGSHISSENERERKVSEVGLKKRMEIKEAAGKERNSTAFQLPVPGIGGDEGDSRDGLSEGDSKNPTWRLRMIHDTLSYTVTEKKWLSLYSKKHDQISNIPSPREMEFQASGPHLESKKEDEKDEKEDEKKENLSVQHPSRTPLQDPTSAISQLPPTPSWPASVSPSFNTLSASSSMFPSTSVPTTSRSTPLSRTTSPPRNVRSSSAVLTYIFKTGIGLGIGSNVYNRQKRHTKTSFISILNPGGVSGSSVKSRTPPPALELHLTKDYPPGNDSPTSAPPSPVPPSTTSNSRDRLTNDRGKVMPLPPLSEEEVMAIFECGSSKMSTTIVYVINECSSVGGRIALQHRHHLLPANAKVLCLAGHHQGRPSYGGEVKKKVAGSQDETIVNSDGALTRPSLQPYEGYRQKSIEDQAKTPTEKPAGNTSAPGNETGGEGRETFHQYFKHSENRVSGITPFSRNLKDVKELSLQNERQEEEGGEYEEVLESGAGSTHLHEEGDSMSTNSSQRTMERNFRAERLRRLSRDLGLSHYQRPDSAPQLRHTPIERTVSPGSPVSLKCSAQGSPTPVISWTRDRQPLMSSIRTSVGTFRTSLGEIVSHVNLSDATVRDGGTYTCTAHNVLGSTAYSARLNVYGPPFVRAMPNVTAVSGDEVRLWCPAGGFPAPAITWRKDGQSIPSTVRQEVLNNGTLIVRNAGQSDVGRYSCVVSDRQGSKNAVAHTYLHVLKPPEIEPFSFGRDMEEGTRTQLSCAVNKGDLPMTINWLKDGRHLQHDPDVESKQISEFSTVLVFKSLREHHSGAYTCEAANAAATVNHTTTVRVKVAPKWVVEPSSRTALVGSTVALDCSARGYPQPVITWLKATGETAQDFQQVVLNGVHFSQASNGSLLIMDTSTSDAGWFLCSATNSVGKPISKVVQLTMHAPARVMTEGGRLTGHAGQTITVPCEAKGDSPLTLTWQRHHTPITPTHRVSIGETTVGNVVRAVLEIREVTSGDAGAYTCRADNPHGHHAQVFTLAVIEPPTAPSRVTIGEVSSRSALISWTLPQPAAVTIQYRAAEEKSWVTHGRNVSVGQWAASHMLGGLTPYQAYAVRLLAHNDLGVSQPSRMQIFTTLEEAPTGAPRDVQVTSGGPRSLIVKWHSPSSHLLHGPLRGYTIALRRQNLQGHLTFITRPAMVATESSVQEQYEVLDLIPSSLYEVAVRAFTRAGAGPLSSPRIVFATGHDAPSCSPMGVSCRGSGRGGIRVWWSPPPSHCANAPVSGYTILVSPTSHGNGKSTNNKWEVNTTNLEKNLDGLPPARNISVRVKAFNDVGSSPPNNPVYCLTEDDVPGPPARVRVIVTSSSRLLVTWLPPEPFTGSVLHYTLYSARDDQVAVRDVVGAAGSESTWRELTGLVPNARVQVWVTATTLAGEGKSSPRLTAVPSSTPKYSPIAVGGGLLWRVGSGAGVTLGCRGLGMPPPAISWTKGTRFMINNGQYTQLLPGGDLHLTGIRETSNFTCWVKNAIGMDSLTHQVIVISTPMAPMLSLSSATHDSLNLSITPAYDGGAPILGYTLHHRGRAGEWVETSAEPGNINIVLRGLSCGAPYHLYVTAWNSHGTSSPSPVLVTNTQGKASDRPDPLQLVEVNATCVILRLYSWPEAGCPITHWKVELANEKEKGSWHPLHAHIDRSSTDVGLCDLSSTSWHLLRLTAASTAGDTVVVYRVATGDYNGGSVSAESVQEVVIGGALGADGWLDAHVVAGIVSAILLATALIICICVIARRRRYGGYRQGESLDNKDGGEDDNARNCEITRSHLYSPTPTKKPRGSLASVKTQDDVSDPYEICPYATFSVDSSEGTLEYGLSLHAMTPRDCLDHPVHSDRHVLEAPTYGHASRQRAQTQYKETEIAYISNRGRAEYASRPKSISGTQPTPAPTPTPVTAAAEQRAWTDEARKDTRGRPHRSRSQTRNESTQRDSSTESNDASSPAQQRQHYQHPQITQQHIHQLPATQQQQVQQPQPQHLPPQHPQQIAAGRGRPHPLPPVRLARRQSESSSSDDSPLTPPRPLHPPSAFSDSRELSEAECDREMFGGGGGSNRSQSRRQSEVKREGCNSGDIKAELTVLLKRYKQQQDGAQQFKEKVQDNSQSKNPYSINV